MKSLIGQAHRLNYVGYRFIAIVQTIGIHTTYCEYTTIPIIGTGDGLAG